MRRLPTPGFPVGDGVAAVAWVGAHLDGLYVGELTHSDSFVGGQSRADAALANFDVTGYAARRNEVWPRSRRGASMLSPYIRHGLLTLPRVWQHVGGGPPRDVAKFRDELLWQEYARHLYARLGSATAEPLRYRADTELWAAGQPGNADTDPRGGIDGQMACWQLVVDELDQSGWLPNQARMWFASHWSVRRRWSWQAGEDYFFARLLDGSRAANRLGWQWTVGTATGKPYGFSRWQVNKRAPGLCNTCVLNRDCPIEQWPDDPVLHAVNADPRLRRADEGSVPAGPEPGAIWWDGEPATAADAFNHSEVDAVWITAESLGDDDPALSAHSDLPAVFVFDEPLLGRLGLTASRLAFLVECLADLAQRREVEVFLGAPVEVLRGRRLAATFTPVPGWHRIASAVAPREVHPWPWLRRPGSSPVTSFSAWRR